MVRRPLPKLTMLFTDYADLCGRINILHLGLIILIPMYRFGFCYEFFGGQLCHITLWLLLFFLQFLEFLFRNVLQQVLLDVVFGRQLEAVFADEEILR